MPACGVKITSTPSTLGSSRQTLTAVRKRTGLASPMMSTGLLPDQLRGKDSLSRSRLAADSLASSTPYI
ncbi:hypothetical protein D3C85_1040380 [compost metagenome]